MITVGFDFESLHAEHGLGALQKEIAARWKALSEEDKKARTLCLIQRVATQDFITLRVYGCANFVDSAWFGRGALCSSTLSP